jgi:hypothetical protein
MSDCKDLHRFIKGEIRVDGFKSEWRKDFEAYLARKPEPKFIKKAVHVPVVIKKACVPKKDRRQALNEGQRKRRLDLIARGICVDCGKESAGEKHTVGPKCRVVRTTRERNRYQDKKAAA